MDDEPGRFRSDAIYVIESDKLQMPSRSTLKILQRAKVIITGQNIDYQAIKKRIEFEALRGQQNLFASRQRYEDVYVSRFIVLEDEDHFKRLQRVIQHGSKEDKNQKESRVYQLNIDRSKLDISFNL